MKEAPSRFFLPLLILITLLTHIAALQNQFTLDDLIHITNNEMIRSLANLPDIFRTSIYPGNLYRPVLIASYALQYHWTALSPFYLHLFNLILHCAVVILVFQILRKYLDPKLTAFSTLLFAINPIHVEAIASISGRAELLSAFFGLLSLYYLLRINFEEQPLYKLCFWQLLMSLSLLLALLSKESALVMLPLGLLSIYFFPRTIRTKTRLAISLELMIVAVLVYFNMRLAVLGELTPSGVVAGFLDNPIAALPWQVRVINALKLLGDYIVLILFPFELSVDYSYARLTPLSIADIPILILNLSLISALFLACLSGYKSRAPYIFHILWFFTAFLVTSNLFVPIGTIFAERLAYLPSVGIIGLLAYGILRIRHLIMRFLYMVIFSVLFALQSALQCNVWYDSSTLWEHQMLVAPQSAKSLLNYGVVQRNNGKLDSAMLYAKQALEVYPFYDQAANLQGSIYALKGIYSGAEHWYRKALEINPRHVESLNGLARIYLYRGEVERAKKRFMQALVVEPHNFDTTLGLLAVQLREGDFLQSKQRIAELKKRRPENSELQALERELIKNLNSAS